MTPPDADPIAEWIGEQLAEPWPLSVEQLDRLCRVLGPCPAEPARATTRASPPPAA